MATPRTIMSEIFYHKTSALRVELGSYNDQTKFKIEAIPALQGQEKRFDYDNKISMVFGLGEILRIKKIIENILNPQKAVPETGYMIEHFFKVGNDPDKKKSMITFKRLGNKSANNPASPYQWKHTVVLSIYNSLKGNSVSFGMSEEEAYLLVQLLPEFAVEFMKENQRISNENWEIKKSGGRSEAKKSPNTYRASNPGAEAYSDVPGFDEAIEGDDTGKESVSEEISDFPDFTELNI